MGGRAHAHNMLHTLQKRREREGGKACFEMCLPLLQSCFKALNLSFLLCEVILKSNLYRDSS